MRHTITPSMGSDVRVGPELRSSGSQKMADCFASFRKGLRHVARNVLNLYITAIRVALKPPRSSRAKTGCSTKGVFHELHVIHFFVFQLAKDGEGSGYGLLQFGRRISESSEHCHLVRLSKNVLWRK